MKRTFIFIKEGLLDILFPKKCVNCGKLDFLLCDRCKDSIEKIKKQTCPFCTTVTITGKLCQRCKRGRNLTGIKVLAKYNGALKAAINEYKYENLKALREDLSEIAWMRFGNMGEKIILTYVPTTKKRFNLRGFNPSREIAASLAAYSGITLSENLLSRKKFIKPQVGLRKKDRAKNVEDSFKYNKKISLEGKKVVIFDDIATTGATLEACAKELRKMGAKEIWGFVLAKNF